ncbi:MAG TPA: cyanophycin synthetase, partial [bacterium]|nr:cyanophycin synthetase [bacterium]
IPNDTQDHREHNADICRAAGLLLGMSPLVIELALENTKSLPCRLETVQTEPCVILDGAHNAAKMNATVARVAADTKGKVHVIFGCKGVKDSLSMVQALSKIADKVSTTRYTVGYGNPENPAKLLAAFPKRLRHKAFLFPHEALADALKNAKKSDTILITGSLYLAGEIRTHWRTEKQILKDRQS